MTCRPQLPQGGHDRGDLSISNYLHEFFADGAWPKDEAGRDESDAIVASRFAKNAFWPTGDNRAKVLFLGSFWIFFVILLPPPANDLPNLLLHLVLCGLFAWIAQLLIFAVLRFFLRYVDELLVVAGDDSALLLDTSDPRSDRVSDRSVFISYRRRDSAAHARSLHAGMIGHFQADRVFMDIADILPGDHIVDAIDRALDDVDVLIVVIGERWLTLTDDNGEPRINDPKDIVHVEVATALKGGKRIIPVTVGGAGMPRGDELPEPLRPLAQLNAMEMSDTRWSYDLGRLVAVVKTV